MLKLYNTLSRKIEDFKPIKENEVSLYTCGPTVYHFAHIGNLRTYIFEDLLRRVLEYDGYKVDHAMNITDVGHLVGDGDEGEDKMEVGAKREGKSPLEIAKFYEDKFFADCKELNILYPNEVLSATQSIPEQIEIIKILGQKGFTYKDEFAIYFDTSKLPDYGKLTGQNLADKKTGARGDVVIASAKKNPADFALWFFLKGRYVNHILYWPSPWGEGFPGWHIECSAISRKLLGQPFDIHTGGVDHIGTHHTNEIAQSEAAFGTPLANYWMHGEFLLINSGRMGKSEGNLMTLDDLKAKGFSPLDYRYLCLTAHYRTQMNFTWENLKAAKTARINLMLETRELVLYKHGTTPADIDATQATNFDLQFKRAINEDLNIPQALATVWEMLKNKDVTDAQKLQSIQSFDRVLGLKLDDAQEMKTTLPENIRVLSDSRMLAKRQKDFTKSDELRQQIEALGYEVMDTPEGQKIRKKL
jgi:cysteinyl-tRNA synthetase